MKKVLSMLLLAALMLCSPVLGKSFAAEYRKPTLMENPAILQNIIARLMINDLKKATDEYYSQYADYLPTVEVYAPKSSTEVLEISYDSNNNIYIVTIKVQPYVAAHIQLGEDIITFQIDGIANVTVLEYQHTKSYGYPSWLDVELKKPFPPDVAC